MTDPNIGLTTEEVARRTAAGMSNVQVESQSKTRGQIVKDNVFTFFNFIFIFFAILLITARSFANLTFMIVVVINAIIGIVQELKAKSVLDKMTMLNAPKTTVIRDGKRIVVDTVSLVKGDICVFTAGNQIGADAKLVSGEIKVNESLVTGESDEIRKAEGDSILSGSFVVSGECLAELTNVGLDSYISKLSLEAKGQGEKKQTKMMRALTRLLRLIGIVMVPLGIIMFVQDYTILNMGYEASISAVVAALVGMIPEGLYLLTNIRLATSAASLGMKKVLVHEMASVETLARVDTLCLDKTGTLTENVMSFEELVPLDGFDENEMLGRDLSEYLADFVAAMTNDNMTIEALKKKLGDEGSRAAIEVFPFTSKVKYSAVTFEDDTYILGAPEKLLLEDYDLYEEEIASYMNIGNRVLLFGRVDGNVSRIKATEDLDEPVIPLGLVLLTNPVRKTAARTMKYFQKQGVDIKVVSGDNPATVAHVAGKCGIEGAENVVDAGTLKTDDDIREAVKKYSVFGRVRPDQKKKIVTALQEEKHVVAMTGDGVNDVLALKTADCSIAMGNASDVVENVSQIVLLDSDFSKMPDVVAEGRQVVNNIQRTASLFLVKNLFSLLTAIFVMIVGHRYPIFPAQMSFYSFCTIGAPGFLLAMQKSNELIKGSFLQKVIKKAIPAGVTEFIMVEVCTGLGALLSMSFDETATMASIVMLVIGCLMVIHIAQPMNAFRRFVVGVSIFFSVGGIILIPGAFKFVPLNGWEIAWTIILSAAGIVLFAIVLQIMNRLIYRSKKKRNKKPGIIARIMRKLDDD